MLRGDGYYGRLWKLEDGRCGYINHVYAHPITNEPMATIHIVPCPQNQSVDNKPIFFDVDGTGGYSGGIQIIVYENPNGAGQVYNADEWQSMGGGSFVVTDGQIIYFPGNSTLPMVNYRSELIAQLGIPNFGPNARPDLYAWLNDPFNGGYLMNMYNVLYNNGISNDVKFALISAIEKLSSININNYPGMNLGYQYEWWIDEDFILNSGNFDMPSNADATIFESPNTKELALFVIFSTEALIHIENSKNASNKAKDLVLNGTLTGITNGKADAFRHAFWNALGSAKFGTFIMKLFADAHEYGETGMATQMDFYNNSKGRGIGENYNVSTGNNVISNAVLQALTNGQLKYISPLGPGGYILQNSQLILTNQ